MVVISDRVNLVGCCLFVHVSGSLRNIFHELVNFIFNFYSMVNLSRLLNAPHFFFAFFRAKKI